ncbi:hypothetical protein [Massilia sp. PWRC2]|uniref:hypothetical protein n=1 Tax=Massilia sp. PWRC2 TaxID=2804626 RepID=UPI003CE93E5B
MKRIVPIVILLLFAVLAWNMVSHAHGIDLDVDGDHFDGPLGAIVGLLCAGGGLLLGGLSVLLVGAVLALVFAGVGVLLMALMMLVALVVAAALMPVLLPLLLPLALLWWLLSRRNSKPLAR